MNNSSSINKINTPQIGEFYGFLNDLKKSGFTDMDQSVRYLSGAFGLPDVKAAQIYEEWKKDIKKG